MFAIIEGLKKYNLQAAEHNQAIQNNIEDHKTNKGGGREVGKTKENKYSFLTEKIVCHQYKCLVLHILQLIQQLKKKKAASIPNRNTNSPQKKQKKEEVDNAPNNVDFYKSAYPLSFWGAEERFVKILNDDFSFVKKCEEFIWQLLRLDWIQDPRHFKSGTTSKNLEPLMPPNFPPSEPHLRTLLFNKNLPKPKELIPKPEMPPKLKTKSKKTAFKFFPTKTEKISKPTTHNPKDSLSKLSPKKTAVKPQNPAIHMKRKQDPNTICEKQDSEDKELTKKHKFETKKTKQPNEASPGNRKRPSSDKEAKQEKMNRHKVSKPLGLTNKRGNCSQNSVLQCLFALPCFAEFLNTENRSNKTWSALKELHGRCFSKGDVPDVKKLSIVLKNHLGREPNKDAHLFLQELLNCVHDQMRLPGEVKEKGEQNANFVENFNSLLVHNILCTSCSRTSSKFQEKCRTISISVPSKKNAVFHINTLIKQRNNPTFLGTNSDCCKVQASLRETFSLLPKTLVLHLERDGDLENLSTVDFSDSLLLSSDKTNDTYLLRAVINRRGTTENGQFSSIDFFLQCH